MATRVICFDMDGVLVDSFEAWYVGVNAVAARLGFPPIPRDAFEAGFGQGVTDDVRTFYPGADPDVVRAEYEQLMPTHVEHMQVNPEALQALTWLGKTGVQRVVVTNTQQALAERILAVHGLDGHVDVTLGISAGIREKPAPDLIERALSACNAEPTDAWMVGDTDYDGDAAEAAGVRFCRYVMSAGTSLLATVREL